MSHTNHWHADSTPRFYFAHLVNDSFRHNGKKAGASASWKPVSGWGSLMLCWRHSSWSLINRKSFAAIHPSDTYLKRFPSLTECRRGLELAWSSSDGGTESLMTLFYAALQEALFEMNLKLVEPQETDKLIPARWSSKFHFTWELDCWINVWNFKKCLVHLTQITLLH